MLDLPDLLGALGVALILTAYALLQSERLASASPWYSLANAVGSALILVSLYFDFNLPSALVEGAWLVISLFGLGRSWRARQAAGVRLPRAPT
ncbi:MAG: hypothetical protein D6696_20600 [Acidobacteria bacterium]|nr:MAG: hypothetical protein D6696_20600 [Acidobacteriota bacterium]